MSNSKIIEEALFLIENNATIRTTAQHFKKSKTTIHTDLKIKLKKINPKLSEKVNAVLREHFRTKHINGGKATKLKYETR